MGAAGSAPHAYDGMSSEEEAAVKAFLDTTTRLQIATEQEQFNDLTTTCFEKCIKNFHASTLSNEERQCVRLCSEKFMNFNRRISQRFMEQSPLGALPSS